MSITIKKMDSFGRGIGYTNKIVFVNDALIDEEVEIDVIKEKKNAIEANVKTYLKESNLRIKPKCPYYKKCGGCNLMHISYENQVDYKLNNIINLFNHELNYTNIKLVQSNKDLFYRNKITLKVKNNKYGYYKNNTHEFIEIDTCLLVNNFINDFIKNKYITFNDGEIIIRINYNNELLIVINTENNIKLNNLPNYVIGVVVNNKVMYGNNYFYDMIGDYKFKISYDSFFQINNYVANEIFKILNNYLNGENILDLYCGVGTLGISLKNNYKSIYGIEKIDNAIKNAKENALLNNLNNSYYYAGDAGKIMNKLNVNFDTILIDPPRSGLNKETLDNILKIKPNKIGYVSCNPHTLIRDLKILIEYYDIKKINVLDMFPNTYHVETVCVLEKK